MSIVKGFGINGKSYYTNVAKPSVVHCTFTVAATNSLGITSLKSNGYVNNVFMHTSTTPGSNNGQTNPNPASGLGLIQFTNNFNYYLTGFSGLISPNSGSDVKIDNSAMTVGQVYTITTLGNATAAKWTAIGVPAGVTPAVGVSFVALTNGGSGNTLTSKVQVPSVSGITGIELIGDPSTMIANSSISANGGSYLFFQFLGPTFTAGAYTPAGTNSAPAFSGSALGTHVHDLLIKGGQAASTTNDVAVYGSLDTLGKEQATDATIVGSASATKGGVVAISAGTPAGSVAAPTFTGTAASLTGTVTYGPVAPAAGTKVSLTFYFDGSSVTVDGI